jgi:hypothetical protein
MTQFSALPHFLKKVPAQAMTALSCFCLIDPKVAVQCLCSRIAISIVLLRNIMKRRRRCYVCMLIGKQNPNEDHRCCLITSPESNPHASFTCPRSPLKWKFEIGIADFQTLTSFRIFILDGAILSDNIA